MDIKIGRAFRISLLILFGFSLISANNSLELRIMGKHNDTSVNAMTVGVPYRLELKAEGSHDLYKCTIPGLEKFHYEFCGASHVNYMSHITTVHSYVIRADSLGTFVIGPVTLVTKNGETITSNAITVRVEKEEHPDVLVELVFDKISAVVGQRLEGHIRINSALQSELVTVQIPSLEPELGNFAQSSQITHSKRTINGKNYTSTEFPVTVLFKKPGKFGLPKIGVLCRVPMKRSQRMWGLSIFQSSMQEQWFYSTDPAVIIDVKPLPALQAQQRFIGVGQFDSISLQCKQKTATRGEGIVTVLEIIGKEGVEDIQTPELVLLDGLKYYDSKVSNNKELSGLYKKTFEYIVQATRDGIVELPAQEFTYFDTRKNSYATLKTLPFQLTISSGKSDVSAESTSSESNLHHEYEPDDVLAPLKTDGPWIASQERSLSPLWFSIFLCSIIALALLSFIIRLKHTTTDEYNVLRRKKNAFKISRKKIKSLKQTNNYAQLYDVFHQLFRDRCHLSSAEVSEEIIEQQLQKAGFVRESLEQWKRFFMQLAELAYCRHTDSQRIPDDLFNRALMWINQLEEKL